MALYWTPGWQSLYYLFLLQNCNKNAFLLLLVFLVKFLHSSKAEKYSKLKEFEQSNEKKQHQHCSYQVVFIQCSSVGKVEGIYTQRLKGAKVASWQQQRWGSIVVHFPHKHSRPLLFHGISCTIFIICRLGSPLEHVGRGRAPSQVRKSWWWGFFVSLSKNKGDWLFRVALRGVVWC